MSSVNLLSPHSASTSKAISSRIPQPKKLKDLYPPSDSSDDEEESTVYYNQKLHEIQDKFSKIAKTSSEKQKEGFTTSGSRSSSSTEPTLQALSSEASKATPSLALNSNSLFPETGAEASTTNTQNSSPISQPPSPVAEKPFNFEAAVGKGKEDYKTQQEDLKKAKTQILQLGFGLAILATVGHFVLPALLTTAPVSGHVVLSATGSTVSTGTASAISGTTVSGATLTKIATVGPILSFGYQLCNTVSELLTNKQKIPAAKSLILDTCSGIKRFLKASLNPIHKVLGTKSDNNGIKFSGGKEQLQEKIEMTDEMLANRFVLHAEQFAEKLDHVPEEELAQAAYQLQNSIFNDTVEYVLQNGTEEQKQRIHKISNFKKNLEVYVSAIPSTAKTYQDLPIPVQNHLRQMIFDTLTSNIDELVIWGRQQALAIGMREYKIREVIQNYKK